MMLGMRLLPLLQSNSTITNAAAQQPIHSIFSRRKFTLQSAAWLSSWAALPALAQSPAAQPSAVKFDVLLAQSAPTRIDPTGYLVSEKLDGVRALWDGAVLRFRSGRTVAAPSWFTAKLPTTPLDGELWLARGQFDALSGMVRKAQPLDADWQQIKYMVFELPAGTDTFEKRAAQLPGIVARAAWPQLRAVEQFRLANAAALQAKLKAVVASGGEGLMLHLASSPVTTGRSPVLLKLKAVQDAEAVVTGHVAGKGKYQGMLGALEVQSANGQRFKLGTGLLDAQRRSPPAIGSTVTYTYNDTTPSGKPRFARFLRVFSEV
jgi:DNA ligase 1